MAAVGSVSEDDYKCPVCFDIFQDPVLLPCSHSFCDNCVRECWRQTSQRVCPVCREISPTAQPPRNLALRNLSDSLRTAQRHDDSAEMCRVHSEKLKLFCEDDQQLICVICRDSKFHKTHNCVPVNEAAETQRAQLKIQLMSLKSKLGTFKNEKTKWDSMASYIKLQTGQTEKTIREEFQKLYRFLRAEETERIDALRKEEAQKSKLLKENITKLESDISALTQKITSVEKEMRAKDVLFMQKVKDTIKRSQCDLTDPQTPRDALITEAKHISNLLYIVWMKMMKMKDCFEYVPVTLNPNTRGELLTISEMMTRASTTGDSNLLPEKPDRLNAVLGHQGISPGKHFWDVEVGGFWALGVAKKSSDGSYSNNAWGILICPCHNEMSDFNPRKGRSCSYTVMRDSFPKRVRVLLDFNQGTLSFIDLDKNTTVHTIKDTFSGTVFPYFEENIKILPAKIVVNIVQ